MSSVTNFLGGKQLTTATKRIINEGDQIKVAIAYWGKDALSLLGLNSRKKTVKVICCLRNGASDPAIISRFGKRARQNDKLHAKVIWTPKGAIIGSANASSNGLPEEEELANGLIEAGIYVNNSRTLASIESWFDFQFKNARPPR